MVEIQNPIVDLPKSGFIGGMMQCALAGTGQDKESKREFSWPNSLQITAGKKTSVIRSWNELRAIQKIMNNPEHPIHIWAKENLPEIPNDDE